MRGEFHAAPRHLNTALGLWLWLSAFLWPHSRGQVLNAWIVGMLAVGVALTALDLAPRARYVNVALGVWLIASSVLLPGTNVATMVNHVVAGLCLAALASLRGYRETEPRTR